MNRNDSVRPSGLVTVTNFSVGDDNCTGDPSADSTCHLYDTASDPPAVPFIAEPEPAYVTVESLPESLI